MTTPSAHHIAIEVSDIKRALSFYRDSLLLEEIPRLTEGQSRYGGAWFRLGNLDLHLQERPASPEKSGQHLALVVIDLEGVMKRAVELGGRREDAKALEGFSNRAFLRDPDNNRIELLEI